MTGPVPGDGAAGPSGAAGGGVPGGGVPGDAGGAGGSDAGGWLADGWANGDDRYARIALSFLADPGDQVLGELLSSAGAAEILAAVLSGRDPASVLAWEPDRVRALENLVRRWRSRIADLPEPGRLAAFERGGFRLVCPGDPEWPTQLDDLGGARPLVLWLRGAADLRFACLRSVSLVGSRAATAYGTHVSLELAADLAGDGWAVISGGAFGIDTCAHRGALVAGGCAVAVLAGGLRFGYPKGNRELFEAIAASGVTVSESPPDRAPLRPDFLVRNRVIAALSRGTVIGEAMLRSGALNTARHARELNRPVMAVPGPVTSAQSAGCHQLIREYGAALVTSASDVIEMIAPLGEASAMAGMGADGLLAQVGGLDPLTQSVLAAVPVRAGRGPAGIALAAGVDLDTALRCLGLLAAAGYVERCDQGWRRGRTTRRMVGGLTGTALRLSARRGG